MDQGDKFREDIIRLDDWRQRIDIQPANVVEEFRESRVVRTHQSAVHGFRCWQREFAACSVEAVVIKQRKLWDKPTASLKVNAGTTPRARDAMRSEFDGQARLLV